MISDNLSFIEWYGKATYTINNDDWVIGIQEWYSPSVLNSGAAGWYTAANITYTAPSKWLPNGAGMYVSADAGCSALGTSDSFYGEVSPTRQLRSRCPL